MRALRHLLWATDAELKAGQRPNKWQSFLNGLTRRLELERDSSCHINMKGISSGLGVCHFYNSPKTVLPAGAREVRQHDTDKSRCSIHLPATDQNDPDSARQ
jgi:hypothetical protein